MPADGKNYVIQYGIENHVDIFYNVVVLLQLRLFTHRLKLYYITKMEVAVVRVKVTLECEECKHRNYNLTKDKKLHPDRMETKKYCKCCKKHTLHKETK